jgi:pre-mRNA-splicing factor ISY1
VKELFQSRKKEEEEDTAVLNFYKKFTGRGPAYFGDEDEQDAALLAYERAAEDDGPSFPHPFALVPELTPPTAWEEAYQNARGALGLPLDAPVPEPPRHAVDGDVPMDGSENPAHAAAAAAASLVPFLSAADLLPPTLPTRAEMDGVLLALRKKALVEEYFG